MSTTETILKTLKTEDEVFASEITGSFSENEIVDTLNHIVDSHFSDLKIQVEFRNNFLNLVSYLILKKTLK